MIIDSSIFGRRRLTPLPSTAIDMDGMDPQYAASLRSLGAVQPNTMYSPSSTFHQTVSTDKHSPFPDPRTNPAVQALQARDRFAAEAEQEFEAQGTSRHGGRQYLDVHTIRQILTLRDDRDTPPAEIERQLDLRPGVVERLGKKGVLGAAVV